MKMDSISLPSPPIDEVNKQTVTDSNDLGVNSSITVSIVNTVHDYRHDLNGKLRTSSRTNSIVHLTDNSKAKSSGSRSRSRSRSSSKDQHRQQRYRSPSYNSSNKPSRISSDSNKRSRNYSPLSSSSSSSRSSLHDNHRRSQQRANRTDYSSERKRSFELSNRHHYQSSKHLSNRHELFNDKSYHNPLSNIYPQRSVNDLIPPNNVHHLSQQQPVRHKRFNYNHQSVADHPRFANTNPLSSPASIIDNNYPKSPPHCRQRHSPSPVAMVDRKIYHYTILHSARTHK
ncbi:hypothetical protein I4U23_020837 [Adineta vaga]|nr:hypothetical protein I4U23_020837 [Adineta vaga]